MTNNVNSNIIKDIKIKFNYFIEKIWRVKLLIYLIVINKYLNIYLLWI